MMSSPSAKRVLSLRDVVSVLFRRQWVLLGIFFPVVMLVATGAMLKFSVYEASAKILMQQERFALLHVPNETTRPFITRDAGEELLNSQIELLLSQSLYESVVRTHQLHLRPPCPDFDPNDSLPSQVRVKVCRIRHQWRGDSLSPQTDALTEREIQKRFERTVMAFQSNLKIVPIKQSKLILIRYQDRDPELAARVVNDLISRFQAKHLQLNQTAGAYELYRSEAEALRDRLVASEGRLQQFRDRAGIIDLDRQKQLSLGKMSEFEAQLRATEAEVAQIEAQMGRLKSQLAAQPEWIATERREVQNSALDNLKASLMALEVKRSQLREKFTPEAQPLREVESQILQARRILAQETATRVQEQSSRRNPNVENLEAALLGAESQLSSLRARQQVLQQHVEDYHEITRQLDTLDFQMAPLQRELERNVNAYLGYLKKEEEARFAGVLDQHNIVNVKVAEPAHIPIEPVAPSRSKMLLLGLILGSMTAVGLAFAVDRLDHSLKTPDDVEQHLGLPLLASVPVHKPWT
ncbi:GumC family protein [Candidatus Entotheonella palauensis]|uniref:GumC family protein n=1 Tax=Candidatus Entotheonella palauensis TaxID=93172 RepID=UPI000B7E628F|nr:GumC family protein [Candidatus Entotheonella palauensis]